MKRPLERYAEKRAFTRTPEPAPKLPTDRRGPLLFVIQKHAARRLHYDFRLECDGVLKSWAVPKGPSLEYGDKRLAVEVEDHPFDYGSFEGVIPAKEYGAGNVIVWDCGVYSPDEDGRYSFGNRDEAQERIRTEFAAGKINFFLRGEKLKGSFALVRTSSDKQWLLLKHKDRFVTAAGSDVLARSRSVLSGRSLDELATSTGVQRLDAAVLGPTGPSEALPKKLDPMLAESDETASSDPNWLYEPKVDGYRVIAFVANGVVRLQSRRGIDLTAAFPEIVADLATQAVDSMIVDGEIVALDAATGRPSFNHLQNRRELKTPAEVAVAQREAPVVMLCFDLLHFAGINLRGSTYIDRRRYLSQCLLTTPRLQLVHALDNAEKLYAASLAAGFEGIVAKRKDSTYQPGKRTNAWLKIKATQTAEFVVGGYTKGKGAREALGSLLLGYWSGSKLHFAGHVGSGLDDRVIADLGKQFARLERKTPAFVEKPPLQRPTTWLDPELVVEVTFAEWTPDGMLRAPVFQRVRDDIESRSIKGGPKAKRAKAARLATPANEVAEVLQQLENKANRLDIVVGGAKIRLTNLDRVYWPADLEAKQPAITKRDLVRYLAGVSSYMLPHLRDRPLTMIRMPEGITGERFYQKHWEQARPDFVPMVTVYSGHKDEKHDYVVCNNLPTLLWLGQSGTLEFHVWHSRANVAADTASKATDYASSEESLGESVLNYPDFLVFDIDPYIYSGKEPAGAEPELNKKGFEGGRRVAFWLHALLKQMSLEAVVKTSGKTGLHVFVPINRTVTFDGARQITEMVGRHLLKAHPKEITMEWATGKRTGKIFIDHNMNVRGKTLRVAYSPCGSPGATVSMPLSWAELEAADPTDFTINNVLPRLEKSGDRWQDALSSKQSLADAFGRNGRTIEK
ncbi:MAG TPA: non-homologous end-joining DNA ligase [Steroidobacteraceae bacterium]|jgi:bifunctional non-homologous end joining protein LigD|nr:non-homologous end-joining DNA ligase [Steroidobacteraceae bacterium]